MKKYEIISEIGKIAVMLRTKSPNPDMYRLPTFNKMNRATKDRLENLLDNLNKSLTFLERVREVNGVTFITAPNKIAMMSSEYPFYINRLGFVYENVGIGWVQRRPASDKDLKTIPVLV